jgi:hypothetical protein
VHHEVVGPLGWRIVEVKTAMLLKIGPMRMESYHGCIGIAAGRLSIHVRECPLKCVAERDSLVEMWWLQGDVVVEAEGVEVGGSLAVSTKVSNHRCLLQWNHIGGARLVNEAALAP